MRTNPLAGLALLLVPSVATAQQPGWPLSMDFGPFLMATFDGGGTSGFTHKGAVVKLGDAGAVSFDTEMLRMSAAWVDGWLQLRGTAYDGSHGPMPKLRGRKVAETRLLPGWAKDGSFADPRKVPYGPVPKDWGAWRGVWLHGNDVVLGYTVGGMEVLEQYGIEGEGTGRVIARTMEIGPSDREQVMVVLDGPDGSAGTAVAGSAQPAVELRWPAPTPGLVELDADTSRWEGLSMGAPTAGDLLDLSSGTGAVIRFVPGFAVAHGVKLDPSKPVDEKLLALPRLQDGKAAKTSDDWEHSVWFDKYKVGDEETDDGRFHVDLRKAVDVSRINTFTWHKAYRSIQQYKVYGSDAEVPPAPEAVDPAAVGWKLVADVDTESLGQGDRHGVGIARAGGLGRMRHLLFTVRSGSAFFSEVDVFGGEVVAAVDSRPRQGDRAIAALQSAVPGVTIAADGARIVMKVVPHKDTLRVKLLLGGGDDEQVRASLAQAATSPQARALAPLTKGGPSRWGDPIVTKGVRAADEDAYVVDTVTIPFENRYGSRMRTGAFDFFADGRAAVSTWNGDVWVVSGIDGNLQRVEWKRFATGLYDPLGLRIVDGTVYVHGRDGITRLHDLNGDGEADHYECFNNEVCVTPNFHEFAFDLQTDPEGNFYFSKGAPVRGGGRGFETIAPHHGTLMRVAKDGSRLDVVASGLRAPNGIGISPDGTVLTSGDNEGTFMPRCRINWITKPGYYAGVRDTAHRADVPEQPDLPLCWMPMDVDNSSGGQTWVTSDRWGPLQGRMLHLSYGTCGLYLVLKEPGDDVVQGGVVRFPTSFSSSCMRGRFSPVDGQLYVVGLQGWQTSAAREGGFHRVRWTGKPLTMPVGLKTSDKGVYLTFAEPLDRELAEDVESYGIEIWNYLYSPNYGSPELSLLHPERKVEQGKPNRDPLKVTGASLSADGRTVFLAVEGMRPVMQMKVSYNLETKDGDRAKGEVHNSIHVLRPDQGMPK